ncbi:MAG: PhzF family phenazine biosynthesis protein [Candidatus Eremiobacteraeota bacterium]|nr:PhzF family phenazine biosynthesis protein [Candidatus Eremiobacteraeota bacterium]
MAYSYHVVDVFTQVPFEGNALAVFPDASGLDTEAMQTIARELNLSETSFIFPSESREGSTRVRIFTPASEMEFAGHPTIGTAFVMRATGIVPRTARSFALQENVGIVPVRVDGGDEPLIWLTTPPIHDLGRFDRKQCAAAISLQEDDLIPGVPCDLLSAGNPCIYVALRDKATVDRAAIDTTAFYGLIRGRNELACVFVFTPTSEGAYSRMFAPEYGIVEDPATGSATGPLAAFMMRNNLVSKSDGTAFVSEQGTKMKRRSLLHVLVHGENGSNGIEVGGHVTPVATATLSLGAPAVIQ